MGLREKLLVEIFPTKTVGHAIYLHLESLSNSDSEAYNNLHQILEPVFGEDIPKFNILKIEERSSTLSLLNYPNFSDDPFPVLAASWKIDTTSKTFTYRTYADSLNPPILHRKELLISPSNCCYEERL